MDQQELRDLFNEVRASLRSADMYAATAVEYAAGRLRRMHLSSDTLRALKRELAGFNAKRGRWVTPL